VLYGNSCYDQYKAQQHRAHVLNEEISNEKLREEERSVLEMIHDPLYYERIVEQYPMLARLQCFDQELKLAMIEEEAFTIYQNSLSTKKLITEAETNPNTALNTTRIRNLKRHERSEDNTMQFSMMTSPKKARKL
jgi:hypothetical protein